METIGGVLLIIFFLSIPIVCLIDLGKLILKGDRIIGLIGFSMVEIWSILILPNVFMAFQGSNSCCSGSATFSEDHILSLWILINVCGLVFLFTRNRKTIAPPLTELLINIILVVGVIFDLFLMFHEGIFGLLGTLPVLFLFLTRLVESHRLIQLELQESELYEGIWESNAYYLLALGAWQKYPIVLILCLPVLVILSSVALLFGQEPDSMIRAFTDTYKHGFSQWDYKCDNVQCGGHYLCSVAAQGHSKVVKPIRYGHRNGGLIICNRQLLISNAFEEMILERFPKSHKVIRHNYDKVGDVVKSHYHLFSIKWVSDVVYIFMKPLEWIFLVSLYLFVRNPESKIAKQYIKKPYV